jgi:hypothetical protein
MPRYKMQLCGDFVRVELFGLNSLCLWIGLFHAPGHDRYECVSCCLCSFATFGSGTWARNRPNIVGIMSATSRVFDDLIRYAPSRVYIAVSYGKRYWHTRKPL